MKTFYASELYIDYTNLTIMRLSFTYLLALLLIVSCENPLDKQTEVPGDLIDTTLDIFDGEILERKTDKLDDVDVWKIKIENSNGAITSFYWRKSYFNLFRIVGEQGPFDYDLKPPLDVINFNTAKFLAFNQNANEDLTSWKFMRSPGEIRWFYKFYLNVDESTITVDAGSGEILR